jgi:hypothetical protein
MKKRITRALLALFTVSVLGLSLAIAPIADASGSFYAGANERDLDIDEYTSFYANYNGEDVTWDTNYTVQSGNSVRISGSGCAAVREGTTTILATYQATPPDGMMGLPAPVTDVFTVNVREPIGKAELSISPKHRSIKAGSGTQFTLTYTTGGRSSDVTSMATWSSSNPSVAYLNSPGYFMGNNAGHADIYASYNDLSITADIDVSSSEPVPTSLVITPGYRSVKTGEIGYYTATLKYSDGSSGNVTKLCTWSVGNGNIASSLDSGAYRGNNAGSTYVKAVYGAGTYGSFNASADLTVTASNIDTLVISPNTASATVGNVDRFRAIVNHSSGAAAQDVTNMAYWSISRAIASYNGNGSYTATSAGTATITATYTYNGVPLSATASYSVSGYVPPTPGRPNNASFTIGSTAYYIDGVVNYAPVATYTFGGRTYVPQRAMAAAIGVNVSWDNASQSATFTDPATGNVVVLKLGSPFYTVNGIQQPQMDVAPRMVGNSLTCPARYVASAFGYQVKFDAANNAVNLTR